METLTLRPFQSSVMARNFAVTAEIEREDWVIRVHYRVRGAALELLIPERNNSPVYQDGLYQHTCVEFFVMGKSKSYLEWNFSPSYDWALFAFDDYRKKSGQSLDLQRPAHFIEYALLSKDSLDILLSVDLTKFQRFLGLGKQSSLRIGVSSVLESREGQLSYWALWHPEERADFHREENFSLVL